MAQKLTPQQIQLTYMRLKKEIGMLGAQIASIKADKNEHKSVIDVLEAQPKTKKAFQMIGSVLTESTVEQVLPNLQKQLENFERTITAMDSQHQKKYAELKEFTTKYQLNPATGGSAADVRSEIQQSSTSKGVLA